MGSELLHALAEGVDGLFGAPPLDGDQGLGLGPMELDQAAELLVRGDVVFVVAVPADEVHQGQGMVGVEHGLVVAAQREPGHAAVIELDELAIGLGAVFLVHGPGRRFAAGRLPAAGGTVAEIVEIGGEAVRTRPVGPAGDLELEDAELDPDLQHAPPVAGADFAGQNLARLGVIGPTLDHVVQVPPHQRLPNRSREREQAIRPHNSRQTKPIADDMALSANPPRSSDGTAVFRAISRRIIAPTQVESYCAFESDRENLRRVPRDQHSRKAFAALDEPGSSPCCRMFTVMSFGSRGSAPEGDSGCESP